MKSAHMVLVCLCFVLLQSCSQQAKEGTASTQTGTSTASAPTTTKPGEYTPEQLKNMPKSQSFFVQSKAALDQNKPDECFDLLGKAVDAAKVEHNYGAAIMCIDTQAKLKLQQKKADDAVALLEARTKEFNQPYTDQMTFARFEGLKALLANIYYAIQKKPEKAEAIYKENIAAARAEKPVNHQRISFWMKNYAEFYNFSKKPKESAAMSKEADVELVKDPHFMSGPGHGPGGPGGPGGGAGGPGGGPGGHGAAPGGK